MRTLVRVLLVLWAGSLWSLALWVAPTLFYAQSDRHLAGMLAARFFSLETYLGIGVVLAALTLPRRLTFFWVYVAVSLLVINEWGLRSLMAAAHASGSAAGLSFGAWHGVSAVIYLLACAAVLAFVGRQALPGAGRR
ncbi:MAG: hypothetical protein NVSMB10_05130 [Steroidobacteraceae bacterium]